MNTSLPPALAPYIQQCVQDRSLSLLTTVLETPANWLLARFATAILGSSPGSHRFDGSTSTHQTYNVIFVSIIRSLDLWTELLKKSGLNLQDAISSNKVCYIDGLASSTQGHGQGSNTIALDLLSLKALSGALVKALQHLSTSTATASTTATQSPPPGAQTEKRTVVLIDGLDFLLAAQSSDTTTAIDIQALLLDLQSQPQVYSTIITCAADSPLLHNIDAAATPLELEHSTLARLLAYSANWVFQLRPLETGRSKDVSGSVRISKGGAWEEGERQREDGIELGGGEWLYCTKGDGTVRVWGRGEA